MEHQRLCVASRVALSCLLAAIPLGGAVSADEPQTTVARVPRESISEVMLEDTGLELERVARPPDAGDAFVETGPEQAAPDEAASAPVPARAAPSR